MRRCDADVVLIDRRNHHIFQPLLYQVATAVLAPAEIAAPIRQIEEKQKNLTVMLAEVTAVDLNSRSVDVSYPASGAHKIAFDFLIIAAGMQSSYFGHDEFAKYAPGLKNLSDAETIRTKILSAYELAELTDDESERSAADDVRPGRRRRHRRGAGSVDGADGHRHAAWKLSPDRPGEDLDRSGRRRQSYSADICRILVQESRPAAREARRQSHDRTKVEKVDEQGVIAGGKRIPSATVLWTAGVAASPVVKTLGVPTDRAGRLPVDPFLIVPGVNGVFVVGDVAASSQDGRPVPGVAQVAIQQGRYVGQVISRQLKGQEPRRPFRYFDKGNMAVVGKNFAVLERGRLRMSGFVTWLVWVFIHVMFLPQLQNRLRVQSQWFWSYWTGQRSSRLISEPPRGQ